MNSINMQGFNSELQSGLLEKVARELTEAARHDLPKKDFAVSAKKSNTGEKAYPIPDKQHAVSALGFAKMHHDSADLARVKEKVREKYPELLKGKEKDSMGNFGMGNGALPGMVGGPPGGMGMQQPPMGTTSDQTGRI